MSTPQELLAKLSAFQFDDPKAAMPFGAQLARQNLWSSEFARRVVDEYRRFLFLAVTTERRITPSDAVDQAWHLHMLYSRSYWDELCGEVLTRPLHHTPSNGGNHELERHYSQYQATLVAYEQAFGETAPPDIWPTSTQRFGHDMNYRRVNIGDYWMIQRTSPGIKRWLGRAELKWFWFLALVGLVLAVTHWGDDYFLSLFFPLLFTCHQLAASVGWQRVNVPAESTKVQELARRLDVFEVAYVCGGAERLAQTVVASLVLQKRVLLTEGGLRVDDPHASIRELQPLEASLWVRAAAAKERTLPIEEALSVTQLKLEGMVSAMRKHGLWARRWTSSEVRLVAVLPGIGAVRVLFNLWTQQSTEPLGWWVLFASLFVIWRVGSSEKETDLGRAVHAKLQGLREKGADDSMALTRYVAAHGLGASREPSLVAVVQAHDEAKRRTTAEGCSSSCGC